VTLLRDWQPDSEPVVLEIRYTLSAPIFDGRMTFQAGDYVQRIQVSVAE
jgi:hypothetical protein